jgi:predicted RNA-binding protein with PIN domain
MDLLIDGYNLLHQSPSMNIDRGPGWTTRARRRLMHWLSLHLPKPVQEESLVVFDAPKPGVKLDPEQELAELALAADGSKSLITVRFAVGYEEADHLLIELIARHSHPRKLLVVSSDRAIRTAAQRRRAHDWGSQEWIDALLAHRPEALPPRHRNAQMTVASEPSADDPGKPSSNDNSFNWFGWFGLQSTPTPTPTPTPTSIPSHPPTPAPPRASTPPPAATRPPIKDQEPKTKTPSGLSVDARPCEPSPIAVPRRGGSNRPRKPPNLPPGWDPRDLLDP